MWETVRVAPPVEPAHDNTSDLLPLESPQTHLYFGLVKALGVRTSVIIDQLEQLLGKYGYHVPLNPVHISDLFSRATDRIPLLSRDSVPRFDFYMERMDLGDELRAKYGSNIGGLLAINEIRQQKDVL